MKSVYIATLLISLTILRPSYCSMTPSHGLNHSGQPSEVYFQLILNNEYNSDDNIHTWKKVPQPKNLVLSDTVFNLLSPTGNIYQFYQKSSTNSLKTTFGDSHNNDSLSKLWSDISQKKNTTTRYIVFLNENNSCIAVMPSFQLRIWTQTDRSALQSTPLFNELTEFFMQKHLLQKKWSLFNSSINQKIVSCQKEIQKIENETEQKIANKQTTLDACYLNNELEYINEKGLCFLIENQVSAIKPIIKKAHEKIDTLKRQFYKCLLIGGSIVIFSSLVLWFIYK